MAMYKKGDRVKVRQWDDMKREYGLDSYGAIAIPGSFMPEMREYCGKTVTIEDVMSYTREDRYRIKGGDGWCFSNEMFESPETMRAYEALKASRTPKTPKAPKPPKARKPIIIYQDGRKVTALDTETGKSGVARCHPDDKFDFETGAGLAYLRLWDLATLQDFTPEKKPQYYSGKVVCVENHTAFTVGKIYEIKDGVFYDDDGDRYDSIEDIDWLNERFSSQFIELVE